MGIFFTADNHFCHANVIKYTDRPFRDVWDMNNQLIARWNSKVTDGDIVYVIGDFILGSYHQKLKITDQLKGTIMLVPGGHDGGRIDNVVLLDYVHMLEKTVPRIALCHWSMLVWPSKHYGTIHLFGHSHGNLPIRPNCLDVGVDTNDYYPYSFQEVIDKIKINEEKT